MKDPLHRQVPLCTTNQLSLATDQENGAFDGMSHSGTLLVLRNLGPDACKIEPFPRVTFLQGTSALDTVGSVATARLMHPGPVVLPIVVAAGAEVTASLRWVSGDVYEKGICLQPTALAVAIGSGKQQIPFKASLCGQAGKAVPYEMTRFATDPVYTGN